MNCIFSNHKLLTVFEFFQIYNLLNDPNRGIAINALMEGGQASKPGAQHAVFITKLAIVLSQENIAITVRMKANEMKNVLNFGHDVSGERKRGHCEGHF